MANNLVIELLIRLRDNASDGLRSARDTISNFGATAMTVAKVGLAALVAGLVAVGAAFKHGLSDAADFETILARIRASGVNSAAELRQIGDAAKQMGKDSGAGATEAAIGLEGLIKAGLSTQEAIGALPQILALARGQMLSMDEATTLVIKTVNQFGLSFADSKKVVDTLATGANVAASSVQELAQGLETSGLQARQAGLSLQETVAALNTLMQNGQDAAGAGEALQSLLQELGNSGSTVREELRGAGIATGDFNTVLALLDQGGADATAVVNALGESAQVAAGVFQTALPFYRDQVQQIQAIGTSAQDAAAIMGNTFNASVAKLNATWGEFWQTLAEPILPTLTEGLQSVTTFIDQNRQALSDWISTIASPLTGTIDLLRYSIAQWNGDTEKAAEINRQMNERLETVGRALSGTSAEYAKTAEAAKEQAQATEAAAQAAEKQVSASDRQKQTLLALKDAERQHLEMAKEAAEGSDTQRYHLEQARLEQERYRQELAKGMPVAQEQAQTQQVVTRSQEEMATAVQAAATKLSQLQEQQKQGLATDQQVTEAKDRLKRAQDDYASSLKMGVERTEAVVQAQQEYGDELERIARAQLSGLRTEIELARAKGDSATVAVKSAELTELESRWAQTLAAAKQLELKAEIAATQAKIAELSAIENKNDAQKIELQSLLLKVQALELEMGAEGKRQELLKQMQQQIQNNTDANKDNESGLNSNTRAIERNTGAAAQQKKTYTLMEDAATGALRELSGLSDGMNRLVSEMTHSNDIGKQFGHQFRGELGKLQLQLTQTNEAIDHNSRIVGTNADAFERNADIANTARKMYLEQAISATELSGRLKDISESGNASADSLNATVREAERARGGFDLLDQQTLDRLNQSIDAANTKLREMQEEARSAREELADMSAELLEAQGDATGAENLRLQNEEARQRAEIEDKLAAAQAENNRELIALYSEQLRMLGKIYDQKEKNLKADAREQKQQTTSNTNTSSGGGSSSSGGGLSITVNAGNARVLDSTFVEDLARQMQPTLNRLTRLNN